TPTHRSRARRTSTRRFRGPRFGRVARPRNGCRRLSTAPLPLPLPPSPPQPSAAPSLPPPAALLPAPAPLPDPAFGVLGGLDPEQRAAAGAEPGPLLVVAGPGTGKTRTLTHRLAYLVRERGLEAERCLAISFTRRACGELRERL